MLVGMPEGMEGATMEEILRWGLIGCGDVTEVKSGPALQRAVGSQLLRVASRRPEQAADWARRHAVPHWHVDIDELLASPDIDAVYIATRLDSHCELLASPDIDAVYIAAARRVSSQWLSGRVAM